MFCHPPEALEGPPFLGHPAQILLAHRRSAFLATLDNVLGEFVVPADTTGGP